MQITEFKAVILNYQVKDETGEIIDSSDVDGPLTYIHGTKSLIPSLEQALDGHSQGERLQVTLTKEQAYGEHDEQLVESVPRENFPGIDNIEPGMRFETEIEDGSPMVIVVVAVDEQTVTVDGNHPLAGKELAFDVEITEVREATSDEIEHGHVHLEGEGCNLH